MIAAYFPVISFSFIANYCFAQKRDTIFHDAGFYNTIQWSAEQPTLIIPQAWIYFGDFYLEARYNYEDHKTLSLYFGRAFSFDKKAEIEITPMIVAVVGKTNGISPGFNFEINYKRFSSFTQCQYTIDLKTSNISYFWDWTGFNILFSKHFGLGGAAQVYQPNTGVPFFIAGPMVRFHHKSFAIEAYAYNFWQKFPIAAIGMEYQF